MPHAGPGAVRQDVKQVRITGPVEQSGDRALVRQIDFQICCRTDHHNRYPRSCSRPMAPARSGDVVSTSPSGSSLSLFMRAGALSIVKLLTSRPALTSFHLSGIDTGAPARGRALNGATSSL